MFPNVIFIDCGQYDDDDDGRLNWSRPWSVEIYANNKLICTGVLTSSQLILTASNCIQPWSVNKLHIKTRNNGRILKVNKCII